ncbi:MAG TPA: HIT domain-containing protein [Propionibacteriaceae bacterium]|nr:HIT domain-containing protein [Propionibacteriaceae bacterium]
MSDDCLFCGIVDGSVPSRRIHEDDAAVAFLDIQPWHRGHTLVVPRRHVVSIVEDPSMWVDVQAAVQSVVPLLMDRLGASGLNVLVSAGAVAGQEVMHAHVHLVPRYHHASGLDNLLGRDSDDLDAVWAQLTA